MTFSSSALASLQQGGIIGFAGGSNPFKAGITGALLSRLIEKFTHSKLSHVGIVPPVDFWPAAEQPWLIESTIWQGVSGPQWNDLSQRLQLDYGAKGGHAWFRKFQPQFVPNWCDLWQAAQTLFAQVKSGKLHYSVERLFGDAASRDWIFAALPVSGILNQLSEHDHGVVCSECAGLLMTAGGVAVRATAAGVAWLPKVEPIAGQPIGCAPEDLWEMPIWQAPVTLL